MTNQQTTKDCVSISGIALHTGARAALKIKPAPENTGIVFRRIDLTGAPEVHALATNVVDVRRGTTIAEGDARVYTVEHVLAALHAFNIDNAIIEMDKLGITGKEQTPYLLGKIVELTEGKSLESNIALVYNNCKLAAQISASY